MAVNEAVLAYAYDANMPRKSAKDDGIKPLQPDWYLPEWMRTLKVSQAKLAKECDWTPSTMHGIYHGRTNYYRDIVNLIASKLKIHPYELLMPPELASAFKKFVTSAEEVSAAANEAEQPVQMFSKENQDRRERIAAKKAEAARGTGTRGR